MGARLMDGFSKTLYRLRWPLAVAMLLFIAILASSGWRQIGTFTHRLASLGDVSNGSATSSEPKMFDTRHDIWFDEDDEGLRLFRAIEDKFAAEDYILIAFEEPQEELGVFSRKSLATIARLTAALERVPGVRQARSLTSSPWIRWGRIATDPETGETEEGLLISDLVEIDPDEIVWNPEGRTAEDLADHPEALSDGDILRRIIAVLGARGAARLASEERVREAIGPEADFDDHVGEPRLLGTLVSPDGRTAAIQLQVLRPRLDPTGLEKVFGDDEDAKAIAPSLHAADAQRAAQRGIDHALRVEKGLAVETPDYGRLQAWIASVPPGEDRDTLLDKLRDPTRNFLRGEDGRPHRKFFEYDPSPGGGYVDLSDPANPVEASPDFRPSPKSDYTFHLAGSPVSDREFEVVGMSDMKMVGYMFLLVAGVLLIVFRRIAGVVTPLLVVFASIAGMLGTMWLMGDLLNNLTAVAPSMLTAVALADSIHLLATYYGLRGKHSWKKDLILEVIRQDAIPVFLTSVTTAIGFYSLILSGLAPVRMLGIIAGTGTILAYGLTMTVIPAFLSLLPLPRRGGISVKVVEAPRATSWDEGRHWGDVLTGMVLRWRLPIIIVSGLLVAASIWGIARVDIDSDFRTMLPDDDPVMLDFVWIEEHLGGIGDLEIVFSTRPSPKARQAAGREARIAELEVRRLGHEASPEDLARLSPEETAELDALRREASRYEVGRIALSVDFLAELDRFEHRLEDEMRDPSSPLRVITEVMSPLDILRKINQVQNENRPESYRVPGEADVPETATAARLDYDEILEEWTYIPPQNASTLVAQYYLQYENGAKPADNLSTVISADRRSYRMQGRVKQATSVEHLAAFERIREIARSEFPSLAGSQEDVERGEALSSMAISGKTLLYAGMLETFSSGYIRSMAVALVLITLVITIIFRSPVIGLVSMVPNVLPIVIPLAFFGLVGWPLDGPSVLVSSVALGVCVDDTIHFLTKFRLAKSRGLCTPDAVRYVFRHVGSALAITSIVLVLGFGVLAFGDLAPNIMMGKLAVAMIGLAWVADFLVTPAILSLLPENLAFGKTVSNRGEAQAAPKGQEDVGEESAQNWSDGPNDHAGTKKGGTTVKTTILFLALLMVGGTVLAQEGEVTEKNTSDVEIPAPPEFDTTNPQVYGRQIAEYSDRYDQGWLDEVTQGAMTLFDARGDSVERKVTWLVLEKTEEGNKSIVRFLSPAEVKGVSALTHEHPQGTDDNWLYLPASRRVRRISGANKTASFQGTEFTYEDLSNLEVHKYDWKYLGEGSLQRDGEKVDAHKVEARPNYRSTGYSRLVVWINEESWRREQIDFYDKADQHLKTLVSSDWKLLHGRFWRAMRGEVENVQTKKRTVLRVEKVFLNLSLYKSSKTGKPRKNLTDDYFTTRSLEGK